MNPLIDATATSQKEGEASGHKAKLPDELIVMVLKDFMGMWREHEKSCAEMQQGRQRTYTSMGDTVELPPPQGLNPIPLLTVNKLFKETVLPMLYRDIVLKSDHQVAQFAEMPDPLSYRYISTITDACVPHVAIRSWNVVDRWQESLGELWPRCQQAATTAGMSDEDTLALNARVMGPMEANSGMAWRIAAALHAADFHTWSHDGYYRSPDAIAQHKTWKASNARRLTWGQPPARLVLHTTIQHAVIPDWFIAAKEAYITEIHLEHPMSGRILGSSGMSDAYQLCESSTTEQITAGKIYDFVNGSENIRVRIDLGMFSHAFCLRKPAGGLQGEASKVMDDDASSRSHPAVELIALCKGYCVENDKQPTADQALFECFTFTKETTKEEHTAIIQKWREPLAILNNAFIDFLDEDEDEMDEDGFPGDDDEGYDFQSGFDDYGEDGGDWDYTDGGLLQGED